MPTSRVLVPPTKELVSLALLVAHLRLDLAGDLVTAYEASEPDADAPEGVDAAEWAQLQLLDLFRQAARQKVEAYTERFFAPQKVEMTFELGEPYVVPVGATISGDEVSGYISSLDELPYLLSQSPVDETWLAEYAKGISVNRQLPWGEAMQQTYTVVLDVPADKQFLGLAKRAVLELTAEWWRNRETTADARGLQELPVSWRIQLAEARLNPLGIC